MKVPYSLENIFMILISIAFVVTDLLISDRFMTWWGVFFGFCFIVLIFEPLINEEKLEPPEMQKEYIEFDDKSIRRVIPHQLEENIDWSELNEVLIVTNDHGPFFDDAHWLLMNKDKTKGVAISNDATGFNELLTKLQTLPNFDNQQVIIAMGCTDNATFNIWKR
ncbi:hypothetical protein EYS14_05410 [Alteromonadaceae bacterium M269]|nr:hypothetical protein EYS14_05410 [Alteromonadaceae bacterium M269]